VVQGPDGTIYVVFRGTDFFGNPALVIPSELDYTDGNIPLALGTPSNTQLEDAMALTQAAIAAAGGKPVVVTGHSLGGGLAGLVSGLLGLKSYLFDPMPFANSLKPAAALFAWTDNGLPLSIFTDNPQANLLIKLRMTPAIS
jgi:hypothetical protein